MTSYHKFLFIHAGGSKTGSSAIQNFCEFNSNNLATLGYAYENTVGLENEHDINSGNGMLLYKALLNGNSTELDEILRSYFGPFDKAICSSEFFADLHDQGWQLLIEAASKLKIKIMTVFFVRSVIPFFLSNYDQSIKNHGEFRTLEEWSEEATWQHGECLRRLDDTSTKIDLQVVSFDTVKSTLLPRFFEIIGCDVDFLSRFIDQRVTFVNRSLTNNEREILKYVNKILGKSFAFEISKMLIQNNPEAAAEHAPYGNDWINSMKTRFSQEVAWVNERFGSGSKLVDVMPLASASKRPKSASSNDNAPTKYATIKSVLDWSLHQLNSAKESAGDKIIKQLVSAKASRPYVANFSSHISPDLPADFDPLAYLLNNTDVMLAGADPIFHYLAWGKSEGRSYHMYDDVVLEPPRETAMGAESPDINEFYSIQLRELIARNSELLNAVAIWKQRTIDIFASAAERERELYARLIQATSDRHTAMTPAENAAIKVIE